MLLVSVSKIRDSSFGPMLRTTRILNNPSKTCLVIQVKDFFVVVAVESFFCSSSLYRLVIPWFSVVHGFPMVLISKGKEKEKKKSEKLSF